MASSFKTIVMNCLEMISWKDEIRIPMNSFSPCFLLFLKMSLKMLVNESSDYMENDFILVNLSRMNFMIR